jgi:hypothetical protein
MRVRAAAQKILRRTSSAVEAVAMAMDPDRRQLARVNGYALTAMQSLHGLVTPSMEAVALQVLDDELVLWFWIRGDPGDIEEDVEEAVVDMDAFLQPENIVITSRVVQGRPPGRIQDWARMIYLAKVSD